jgi:soluble lytic murein transglycosylase-like protein
MPLLLLFLSALATYFSGLNAAKTGRLTKEKVDNIFQDTVSAFDDAVKFTPVPKLKPVIQKARLSQQEVKNIAQGIISTYFPVVDLDMVRAIVEIESNRKPDATRYERHLNESSTGLMQTLLSTAQDMAVNWGATKYGQDITEQDLLNPRISLYFGIAYLNWLRRYGTEEEKIVRNYNGGPKGYQRSATLPYWEKYKKAKARL